MAGYGWDYESISRAEEPLAVILHLTDMTAKPGFSLSRQCNLCEAWDRGCRLGRRPKPPGARDAVSGCDGCWYSYLEAPSLETLHADRDFAEHILARMIEGLDAIPEAHERRRNEHKQRIRAMRQMLSLYPAREPVRRGRVLSLHLEVVR